MFKELIEAIQVGVKGEKVGNGYFTAPVFLPPPSPLPQPIEISTLGGIAQFFENAAQLPEESDNLTIVIDSPTKVLILGPISYCSNSKRPCYLEADCSSVIGSGFNYNSYQELDQFIIGLQAHFAPTPNRAQVLSVVGNLANETTEETLDDGVTQKVTLRSGIARRENGVLPNPVTLKPYCTFPEIVGPDVEFVLRIRKEKTIQAALFKSGGGAWKLEAIYKIREWLQSEIENVTILA